MKELNKKIMGFKEEDLKKELVDFAIDIAFWICNKGTGNIDKMAGDKAKSLLNISSTQLNNSFKEFDIVWFEYGKYKIISIDYINKVASIKSDDGSKFCSNIPFNQLTMF